jgi:hypothetical protein
MAAQQGFVYESNAYNALQKYKISTGGVAGASHDKPDLSLVTKSTKTPAGCELKISPTAAGSLVMKYYNGKWSFGETKGDPEKEMMVSIGNKYKLLENMNTAGTAGKDWRGKIPVLQNDANGKKILALGFKDKKKAYEHDLKMFGGQNEVHIDVPAKAICDYYNQKNTDYLNVGTHGFFLMNKADPLKLNSRLTTKIPDFAASASARIRIRCQYKGGGDYQFVMTLEFSKVSKSPYNLCPIQSPTNVTIALAEYKTPANMELLLAFSQ